jgi:hypothetical protein
MVMGIAGRLQRLLGDYITLDLRLSQDPCFVHTNRGKLAAGSPSVWQAATTWISVEITTYTPLLR